MNDRNPPQHDCFPETVVRGKEAVQGLYRQPSVVESYEKTRFRSGKGLLKHTLEMALLAELLEPRSKLVLDLATGTGRITRELLHLGAASVVAADSSLEMLSACREGNSEERNRLGLAQVDAFRLPFKDGCFDRVVSLRFLRHLEMPDRRKVYGEVLRVLAPGGLFVLDACNRVEHLSQIADRTVYDELYTEAGLCQELTQAGFRVGEIRGYLYHSRRWMRLREFKVPEKLALWLCRKLEKRKRGKLEEAYLWMVQCSKF